MESEKMIKFNKLKEEVFDFIYESDFSYVKANKNMLEEMLNNIYDL